jgi:hypothetical protein
MVAIHMFSARLCGMVTVFTLTGIKYMSSAPGKSKGQGGVFAECHMYRHLLKELYAEFLFITLSKVYICFFLFDPNFFYYVSRVPRTTHAILAHFSKWLIYILNLFHLTDFFV